MTIEPAPTAGHELPQRASDFALVRHHNPRTRLLAAELWDNGFGLPRAHLERQTVSNSPFDSLLESALTSVIESGINLSRPAGHRGAG